MSESHRLWRFARRTAGALLVLLGGLGVVLCAAGVVGTWRLRASRTGTTARVGERAEGIVGVTLDGLRLAQAGLDQAHGDLRDLHDRAREPAPREPKKRGLRQSLMRQTVRQFGSKVEGAQDKLVVVSQGTVVLNALLGQLDETALVRSGRL